MVNILYGSFKKFSYLLNSFGFAPFSNNNFTNSIFRFLTE